MGLSKEDRILIRNLYLLKKNYGANRLIQEFPCKNWKKTTINDSVTWFDRIKKNRLIDVWSQFEQDIIDKAIDNWRKRLRACVTAKGHHFEHLL